MKSIQIDDEVFAHLQTHAKPLIDTPNSTLRRIFKIDSSEINQEAQSSTNELDVLLEESLRLSPAKLKKAPKADLSVLVKGGYLQNGQKLYFVDYKGNRVNNIYGTVSNNRLLLNGQSYSMSDLAKDLLKQIGFLSDSVRGPVHWITESEVSISDIWSQYLAEHE